MDKDRELIVISAINLTEGGTLSILRDCLDYVAENLVDRFDIVALVHKKTLFNIPNIRFLEFPLSKRSWGLRLYYEWIYFSRLSAELKPFLWLSLHDITPRVEAERRAVYCHNPTPFYKMKLCEMWIDPTFALFNKFYSFLYKINIKKNDWVIVQQEWIRKEFCARYSVNKVVVAYPSIPVKEYSVFPMCKREVDHVFFFPTYPRFFKNVEVIGEAARILVHAGYENFEVRVTIDGTENRYAENVVRQFLSDAPVKFIGLQSRQKVFELYEEADCLIFPSKLETWGLPLSEFKSYGKPILVADLPYAHETVGRYDKAKFFDPTDACQLADYMMALMEGRLQFDLCDPIEPTQPFAPDWGALFEILLAAVPEKVGD